MEGAVVSAAHGAIGSLLNTLGTLLTDKYKLVGETKEQIRFLKDELDSMYRFLVKMSDDPNKDKSWEKQVRELSYDIEDSINEFILSVECKSNSKQDGFQAFMERNVNLLKTINTRHKIAKKFEGLTSQVEEVSKRHTRYYNIDNAVSKPNNTDVDRNVLALNTDTKDLVGIDRPRDYLIQLMDEEPASQLKVLSIVGFGGLGKTTLAKEIYRKLEGQYPCRAFVIVSQKQNTEKILRAVLSQAGFVATDNTNMDKWDANQLISELRKFLLNKRYLIVIDDIWDNFEWRSFKCALPDESNGSKVITTTRIEAVARACCGNQPKYIYKMKQLSDQDSRKLFYTRIFGSEACPQDLKELSAAVLRKCGGLPLAIITISSLLASMPGLEPWIDVLDSFPANLEVNRSLEGMRQVLNLSYIYLPHHLRTCMLYIGIYPEDYEISKNVLTKQWVAEGFIGKGHSTKMVDVAKCYFNQLINMSIIQPTEMDYNGQVVSCRVHDMMLDLILHKAREENFLTVIDNINDIGVQQDKIRRLALHLDGSVDDREVASAQLSQIRTLARFGTSSYLPPFSQFKHLRVLIVEIPVKSESEVVLDFAEICHLFELRYLKIVAKSHDVLLHSKIGNLLQLETFHLEFRCHGNSSRDKVAERVRGILRICVEKLCNLKYLHVNADP